jgi:hypothetical protein
MVGFASENYNLTNNALDAKIPKEWLRDQQQVPGINFQTQSIQTVMQIEANNVEYEQSTLARNQASYGTNNKMTLSGTDKWSDYDNSNPIKDVKEAREAIRAKTGAYPTKMILPAKVANVLCEHPKMLAKLSDNSVQILTVEDYQRIFDIEKVVIASSVITDETDGLTDLWGKDVILAYVPRVITSRANPSYGYTYVFEGHPSVERPWYDRSVKSWISGVDYERQALLTSMESGFLFPNIIDE